MLFPDTYQKYWIFSNSIYTRVFLNNNSLFALFPVPVYVNTQLKFANMENRMILQIVNENFHSKGTMQGSCKGCSSTSDYKMGFDLHAGLALTYLEIAVQKMTGLLKQGL